MKHRWINWAVACGLVTAACGPISDDETGVSYSEARVDAADLVRTLRAAAARGDVYEFRTLLFREHARAHGDSMLEIAAAAMAAIAEGGANGFDGAESLVLFYADAIVRHGNAQITGQLVNALQSAGGVRFIGRPAEFPMPILRHGTGFIPSSAPSVLRAMLEALGRTTVGDYESEKMCANNAQSGELGGYEFWLADEETKADVCGSMPPGTYLGDQMAGSEYCQAQESAGKGCTELGAAALSAVSMAECMSAALGAELAEPTTAQDAWLACQKSMVDQVNTSNGGSGAPSGSGLGDGTDGGTGCNCACSCDSGATDTGTADSGRRPRRPGRPDSGSSSDTGTDDKDKGDQNPSVKQEGSGIINVNVNITVNNNSNNQDNDTGDPEPEPKEQDSGGWLDGAIQVIVEVINKWLARGSDPLNEFATTTKECQDFEAALGEAASGRRIQPGEGGGKPWLDPTKAYPNPSSTEDGGKGITGFESCGADHASFSSPGVCGLVDCGNGHLASPTPGTGGCCQAAPESSDYGRMRSAAKILCEAVINCEGNQDCCTPPTARPEAPSPRPPPVMYRRFFMDVGDARRMASDASPSARFLSALEETMLVR
jgi:hypothetical protein